MAGFFKSTHCSGHWKTKDLIFFEGKKKIYWKVSKETDITYEKMVRRVLTDSGVNGPYCKFIKKSFLFKHILRGIDGIIPYVKI